MTRAFISRSVTAPRHPICGDHNLAAGIYSAYQKLGTPPFGGMGSGEVGALFHIQFIGSALQITGADCLGTPGNQCGTLMRGGVRARVPGRSFGGLSCSASFICSYNRCHLLPDRSLRPACKAGCRSGRAHRPGHRPVRVETAPGQPEAPDWRRHRQRPRHFRRLPVFPGHSQQRCPRAYPELPADPGDAADGLRRPDRRRQQGRPAEPFRSRRHLRRREAGQEELSRSSTPA